jgi:hypothetical protein
VRPDPADSPRPLPPPQRIEFGLVIRRRRSRPFPAAAFETRFADRDLNARRPADALAQAAELTFAAPVWGPLALGFGAQFGLGLFEPADDLEPAEAPRRSAPPALQGGKAAEA